MKKEAQIIVIALGGAIIVPDKIQIEFLNRFKEFILKFLKEGYKFIIVAGGGDTAGRYIDAAFRINKVSDEDQDWLGIHATRINAHLLRTIFKKEACPIVLDHPFKPTDEKKYSLFIASGWKPGWSKDYDAVLLARRFKADKIIIASKIDYVYEKDVDKDKNAKPIREINWKKYCKLIGYKWKPGMKAPVDPIAAQLAKKLKMTVIVTKGTDLRNLENIFIGRKFRGTIIKP